MRFRKPAWLRRKSRRRIFAWWPKRLPNGTVVWLEWVERYPLYQGYGGRSLSARSAAEPAQRGQLAAGDSTIGDR